jgi:DNA-binding response OmpR family regulator
LGATLTLRSEPGRGSAFGIRVKRSHTAITRAPSHHPQRTHQPITLVGLRVLCVDDDPNILDGMRELLARWKIDVSCASTVEEAQTLASERPVDVVLADFHLHGGPVGLDLLDSLCRNGYARAGALVTANASETLAREARHRGFDVLRKPVRPAALRALIAALARRARASNVAALTSAAD